jgi:hypothetical protein
MTDFWEAASLSDGLLPRQQSANGFGFLRVGQWQRHDGLDCRREAVFDSWPNAVFVIAVRVAGGSTRGSRATVLRNQLQRLRLKLCTA